MNEGTTTESEKALVAELNDLLQLDHDALRAYDLAIAELENLDYQAAIDGFKSDHERHIAELEILIRGRGGEPIAAPHLATSPMKMGMQAMGGAARKLGGGDAAVLLAFKANERQSREKYRRAARENHPADVVAVLARAAADEARHYAWALETLDELGVSPNSATMRVERALEVANAGMADVVERAGKGAKALLDGGGGSLGERVRRNPMGSALVAMGLGLVAAAMLRNRD